MLTNEELINTKGGINWVLVGVGGAIISFLIGIVDGYTRPLKCIKNAKRRIN